MFQNLIPKRTEEDNKDSLLARAFSKTGPEEPVLPGGIPVGVYRDPYARWRRLLIRISLVLILPLLTLCLVIFLIFNIISTNIKPFEIQAESTTMTNIPLPAGVKPAQGENSTPLNYFKNQGEVWLKNYSVRVSGIESYAVKLTPKDLITFYQNKLVNTRQWQIQRQIGLPASLDTLYVRGRPNNQLEGIYLQVLVRSNQDLKKFSQEDDGLTPFVLAKVIATRSF